MAKPVMVKCLNCKKEIEKETAFKVGTRTYYCNEDCYNEKLNKNKPAPKEEKPKTDWSQLMDYLNELYNGNCNFPLVCAQVKKMKNEYKFEGHPFTDKGIELTLRYYYDILGNSVLENYDGIGIVPYYYEKACNNYVETMRISKQIEEMTDEELQDDEFIVKRSKQDIRTKIKQNKALQNF